VLDHVPLTWVAVDGDAAVDSDGELAPLPFVAVAVSV
jgi:hypothetical protein